MRCTVVIRDLVKLQWGRDCRLMMVVSFYLAQALLGVDRESK